jgi:hypothetical protein
MLSARLTPDMAFAWLQVATSLIATTRWDVSTDATGYVWLKVATSLVVMIFWSDNIIGRSLAKALYGSKPLREARERMPK